VSDADLHTRDVGGSANNLTPGRAFWGNSEQPFLRLTPAQTPFAKSWGGQSPTIGMDEAVEHQADCSQCDHCLGDLG
jgi:hypothetical protein